MQNAHWRKMGVAQNRINMEVGDELTIDQELSCADIKFAVENTERRFNLIVWFGPIAYTGHLPKLLSALKGMLAENGAILFQSTLLDYMSIHIIRILTEDRFYRRRSYGCSYFLRQNSIGVTRQEELSVADTRYYVLGVYVAIRIWSRAFYYLEMASQPLTKYFGDEAKFLLKMDQDHD